MSTIVHLINGLGSGGAERMLARIATYNYGPDGPRQVVISMIDEGLHVNGPVLKAAGITVHTLGMRRTRPSLRAFLHLVGLLRRERPDILMTWLYHADFVGTLAAKFARIHNVIWNVRCADMEFAHYSAVTRWVVASLARMSRWPCAIGTNSHTGRKVHEALGYAPRRWLYLPNGVDLSEWRPDAVERDRVRMELGLAPHHVAVVLVARVDPAKDHANFVAAACHVAARHADVRFVLVGKGTDRLSMPRELKHSVIAMGERTDVARILRGMDVAMLSSAFGEGFPNAIVEAMATQLPCVVTDVGDAAEIVGNTGRVVPSRNAAVLAEAIAGIVVEGHDALKRRGELARARVAARWSIESAARVYREEWEAVLRVGEK